ncbi:MAG TPA: hypothetical protein VHN14_13295 [Kofleriaceae bacterium]|jgi:hypothetical protein|nr:hypothetical protein [Kofleriaceae bacterium]
MILEAAERGEHRPDVLLECGSRERVVLGLDAAAGEYEDPEVRRVAGQLRHRLGTDHTLAGSQVHRADASAQA